MKLKQYDSCSVLLKVFACVVCILGTATVISCSGQGVGCHLDGKQTISGGTKTFCLYTCAANDSFAVESEPGGYCPEYIESD